MGNNRLLVTAVVLIALGLAGFFMLSRSGVYQRPGGMPMPGIMGGMMSRGQMKDMMQRMMPEMLPPGITSESLPDPDSRGAKLLGRYCTQCHNLPNPAMHTAGEWLRVADRMFSRMAMMRGMTGMENPFKEEREKIVGYLKTHAR
ncbi:MAG: hypothetical protein ACYDFU_05185 [Nitrospirota bacterium]